MVTVSKLGAPIAPFFMDKLYRDLTQATNSENFESVHLAKFPEYVEKYVDKVGEQNAKSTNDIFTSFIIA